MGLFSWLFGRSHKIADFRKSISIDVRDDPDFDDLGPTVERFSARLHGSNIISAEAKRFAVEHGPNHFRNGGGVDGFLKQLKASVPDVSRDAQLELRRLIGLEVSRARALHNLRRMDEAGITHCFLRPVRDERSTKLEREMDGRRMTIAEARELVIKSGDDIPRSVFQGEVIF